MDTGNTTFQDETTTVDKQVKYDDKVIKKIVASAIMEIDGLLGTSGKLLSGITGMLQKSVSIEDEATHGITAAEKGGEVEVSIKAITEMGKSIPDIASEITWRVTNALRDVAGLQTKSVNVEVIDTMTKAEYDEKNAKKKTEPADDEEASK